MDHEFLSFVLSRETASPPSLADIGLDAFAPYLLNRAAQQWNTGVAEARGAAAMTTPQLRVLAVLSINRSLTINELADFTVTEQSTMSRTLDSLEALGLIRRTPRDNDLRVRDITGTDAGRARFAEAWPLMFGCFAQAFAGVSGLEYQAFVVTLHKIMANTTKEPDDPTP